NSSAILRASAQVTRTRVASALLLAFVLIGLLPPALAAQTLPAAPPRVEKIGDHQFRIGKVRVDTERREVAVAGTVNDVGVLEFIANTPNGMKAYESAITAASDAITFNAALMLIGLDPGHAKKPTRHFDDMTPEGD